MPKLSALAPLFHPGCEIHNSTFGPFTEIGHSSRITNSEFQAYSYCDRLSDIANTTVGKFANIAAMTRIGPTDHPMENASLHHFLYRSSYYWDDVDDDAAFFAAREARRTTLGPDCWIGHGAIIKPDLSIGAGAVIAAGAVVTRDVAPYMIVSGIPATPLRPRFSESITNRLLALSWWDWPHDRLQATVTDFRSLSAEAFLDKHGG